jgi:hypothetical protein
MALSSAVVTANRSFWTGAKVALPAPVVAPDPEFPEPDEQAVTNAVTAANAESAALLAAFALDLARCRSFPLVIDRSLVFMFPVTKD